MEFLNGVIPAKTIKECINDYEGYKITDDINKMALRLIFAKGFKEMEVSRYFSFSENDTTLEEFKKKVTFDIEKVKAEAKELGYNITFTELKDECTVVDDFVYLLYETTLRLAE